MTATALPAAYPQALQLFRDAIDTWKTEDLDLTLLTVGPRVATIVTPLIATISDITGCTPTEIRDAIWQESTDPIGPDTRLRETIRLHQPAARDT